jgi:hypothetical protein
MEFYVAIRVQEDNLHETFKYGCEFNDLKFTNINSKGSHLKACLQSYKKALVHLGHNMSNEENCYTKNNVLYFNRYFGHEVKTHSFTSSFITEIILRLFRYALFETKTAVTFLTVLVLSLVNM